jgi:hypothetical protein
MIAHEVNRAYCESVGDTSQPPWTQAPDWQKASARNGVDAALADPSRTPRQSHEGWMREKEAAGWVHGPIKDPEADPPTHPCLVPFDDLSVEQRVKDYLFLGVVRGTTPLVEG